jgi:uncharacterized protein (DUF433 family)
MPQTLPDWIFPQLERLATERPERLAQVLEVLLREIPELSGELAAMAVEEKMITPEAAAEFLGVSAKEMANRVKEIQQVLEAETGHARIARDATGVARLVGHPVAVWEVVREYRRLGSVEAVKAVMPLSEVDIRLALNYAGRNPDEIGSQIQSYEEHVERSRAAYQYARAR